MKEFTLPYNHSQLTVHLPESYQVDFLLPEPPEVPLDTDALFNTAFSEPVGRSLPLQADPDLKIGIAINDKTRPVANPHPVTYLLAYLDSLGFVPGQITLFLGSGTHQPMSPEELALILDQETIDKYTIFAHDCDLSPMGSTGGNTLWHAHLCQPGLLRLRSQICGREYRATSLHGFLGRGQKPLPLAWPAGRRSTPTMPC